MYLNKVTLIGNLTRDPEVKSLPNGTRVANFSIATNRSYKDANGNKQESVEYHNIVSFGKQAEVIAQYVFKGHQILIEGRLQTRSWEKDGIKMYRTEIIVENFQFGNKQNQPTQTTEKKEVDTIQYPEETISDEDIPF